MAGHIKLDRKILNWEWYGDINTCRLFIHLLLQANHKEGKWQGNIIGRGQLITGLLKLNEDTGLTIRQLRTCFDKLKMTGEITIKTTNKFRLITICKYDTYQSIKNENDKQNDNLIDSQTTSERQTNDKQATTNNNDKNNKEEERGNALTQKMIEDMIVLEMMKVWNKYNPNYLKENENDYPACLQIAYKIAKDKGWKQSEVLNGKLQATVSDWDSIVQFIKAHSFFRKLSLETLSKKWQDVSQSYKDSTDNTPDMNKKNKFSFI